MNLQRRVQLVSGAALLALGGCGVPPVHKGMSKEPAGDSTNNAAIDRTDRHRSSLLVPQDLALNGAALRGFTLEGYRGRDATFVQDLAATGAGLVRLMLPIRWQAQRIAWDETERQAMRQLIDSCAAQGLAAVVALDLGQAQLAKVWHAPEFDRQLIDTWRTLAPQFAAQPNVVGLDLLNEPNPPWPTGDLAEAQARWQRLAQGITDAIRASGISLPVVMQSVFGGLPRGFTVLQPLRDDQVVYSVHVYTPHEITHQGVAPQWPRGVPYPADASYRLIEDQPPDADAAWNRQRLAWTLRHVVAFQARVRRPILVGEFSCVRWAPDGSADRYVKDCVALFDAYGWHWTYHAFRGWQGWDAEAEAGDGSRRTRSSGAPLMPWLSEQMRRRVAAS